jgi:hypothetical protein
MIDRLRELDSAATPGPWKEYLRGYVVADASPQDDATPDDEVGTYFSAELYGPNIDADAALIPEARNALPKLLAIAEAARDVLENVSPDDDHEGAFLDYLVPFEEIEALRKALDNR